MRRSQRAPRLPVFEAWHIALGIVLLAALALRLYGLNWDDGADLHPDELFIARIVLIDRIHFAWPPDFATLLDPARAGLNPRSADPATGEFREFAYGALPLWITDAAAWLLSQLTGTNWNAAERAYFIGRALSATLSALTILPVAALGIAVGGRAVGLLAALFAALAPMSIQLAHFFTTDSWLAFFVAICLSVAVGASQTGRLGYFIAAGAAMGLGMATKGSVFALAAPIAVALACDLARRRQLEERAAAVRRSLKNGCAAAMAAFLAFALFEPYALLRPDVYLQSLRTQADIVSGRFDVPFTRVYSGTVPILYQAEQFVRWGFGPIAGLLALAGVILLFIMAMRSHSAAALVLTSWLLVYGGVLAVAEVKFLRYLEPLAPVLAVAAGLALVRLARLLRNRWGSWPARLAVSVPLLATLLWTAAFLSIYAHQNPRVVATTWIYATIPPGATVTAEYWDDALPRALGYSLAPAVFGYSTETLDLYRDRPPPDASDAIFAGIANADYIIQSSQRVEAAVRAEPWRYPVQGRFFDLLQRGRLGYEQVAEFVRTPGIAGLSIDDRNADESFINYDHPRVAIYARAAPPRRDDYDAEMSWALQRPWDPNRQPAQPTLLLDRPVAENPSVDDARWSAAITGSTPAATVAWLLLLLLLVVAGLPWARITFAAFPDRGWGFARILGLLLAAYPVWLGASSEAFRFRAPWVLLSFVIVAILGWWMERRLPRRPPIGRAGRDLAFSAHAEAAFWAVFALFLAFRLINPDGWHPLWGGEKPMEFAQINAIARSAYFPPYDPWYADGIINYYYYGFYLMAFLFKAVGIPSELGFNLAVPAVMAMLGSGAFSISSSLANGVTRSRRWALAGGWIGALTVCLLGNLTALRTLLTVNVPAIDPFILWTWNGSRAIDNAITEFPYFTGLYADLHAHVVALSVTVLVIGLCYALASRGGRPAPRQGKSSEDWATLAVLLGLLALGLGTLSATNAWDVPVYALLAIASLFSALGSAAPAWRRLLLLTVATVAMVGGAWLLFLAFHLHFVALFGSVVLVHDGTDLLQFLSHLGGLVAVCSAGLTLLLLRRGATPARSGPLPWAALVLAGTGLVVQSVGQSAFVHSLGALLLSAALAFSPLLAAWRLSRRSLDLGTHRDHAAPVGAMPALPAWPARPMALQNLVSTYLVPSSARSGSRWQLASRAALLFVALGTAALLLGGRPVLGLLVALGSAAALGWLYLRRSGERFVCLLLAAGFFTAAGVEVVAVADDLVNSDWYRMNTIFKFYNQVWILLSVAAAALVALLLQSALAGRLSGETRPWLAPRADWARLGVLVAFFAFLGSIAYPLLATGPRLAQRFAQHPPPGTLNAQAWMAYGTVPVLDGNRVDELHYDGDAEAIKWLWENVRGTPVVAEASIGPYRCNGSRISSATGLPTIIGWERHEQQQRYPESLPQRVQDVKTLYTSADPRQKAAILRKYNVAYIVVGDVERYYPIANNECTPTGSEAGIAAFGTMIGQTLEVAFAGDGTTIYRVLPLVAS